MVCSWIGLASTNPAFSISASNSADKCNSLNFNVLLLSKGGAKPPYKAFDTQLSKHTKFFPLAKSRFSESIRSSLHKYGLSSPGTKKAPTRSLVPTE